MSGSLALSRGTKGQLPSALSAEAETKALRGMCPRLHSSQAAEPGLVPLSTRLRALAWDTCGLWWQVFFFFFFKLFLKGVHCINI